MFDEKNPQESRYRHPHPSMIFFGSVTVYSIDTWSRLSYKQLVFHIYLHRFNILEIDLVTFNKLPCFVQSKSSNAPYVSFIIATNITIIRKKILATVMSSLSIAVNVMSQRRIV